MKQKRKSKITKNLMVIATLYSEIEQLIIQWSNDGTRTAGSLTREIMEVISNTPETIDK